MHADFRSHLGPHRMRINTPPFRKIPPRTSNLGSPGRPRPPTRDTRRLGSILRPLHPHPSCTPFTPFIRRHPRRTRRQRILSSGDRHAHPPPSIFTLHTSFTPFALLTHPPPCIHTVCQTLHSHTGMRDALDADGFVLWRSFPPLGPSRLTLRQVRANKSTRPIAPDPAHKPTSARQPLPQPPLSAARPASNGGGPLAVAEDWGWLEVAG